MPEKKFSLLFLGKAKDADCARALAFCQQNFAPLTHCLGKWGDPLSDDLLGWRGDYIISYLSRWVLPEKLLRRAKKAAINFHPASPEYPGIGCTNFALYDNVTQYGVTCHHMTANVDSGRIIAVKRFPVYPEDGVDTLLKRTYINQIELFYEIAKILADGSDLPQSSEKWTRLPFTRSQFNELFKITPDMNKEEIARRVRAVSYGKFQPYIEIEGFRFEYKP